MRTRGRESSCNLKSGLIPQASCGEKQTEGEGPLKKRAATSGITSQNFCVQRDGEGCKEPWGWPWETQQERQLSEQPPTYQGDGRSDSIPELGWTQYDTPEPAPCFHQHHQGVLFRPKWIHRVLDQHRQQAPAAIPLLAPANISAQTLELGQSFGLPPLSHQP